MPATRSQSRAGPCPAGRAHAERRLAGRRLAGRRPEARPPRLPWPVAGPDAGAGLAALRALGLKVGRPLRPMLASAAAAVADAFARLSPAGVEWKIDGIRIQVHRTGTDVAVFTRTLGAITIRVPEITEAVLALNVRDAVFDGEAVALAPDGRPRPFQVTASRTGSHMDVARQRMDTPLT